MRRKILEAAERLDAPQLITWTAHFACGWTTAGEVLSKDGRASIPEVDFECRCPSPQRHPLRGFIVGAQIFERDGDSLEFRAIDTAESVRS